MGWNTKERIEYTEFPIFTEFKGLTQNKLLKLAYSENSITLDKNGKIRRIYLYNDSSNPMKNSSNWEEYFGKIKVLSKLEVKHK